MFNLPISQLMYYADVPWGKKILYKWLQDYTIFFPTLIIQKIHQSIIQFLLKLKRN